MSTQIKSILTTTGAIGIIVGVFLGIIHLGNIGLDIMTQNEGEPENLASVATVNISLSASSSPSASVPSERTSTTTAVKSPKKTTVLAKTKEESAQSVSGEKQTSPQGTDNKDAQDPMTIRRIENPYPFAPQSFDAVNEESRLALVNIVCAAKGGSLRSTSGSGIIIDPRGVILTNAHVGQYLLLGNDKRVDLLCVIRTGSPAREKWIAEVIYIPPVWVKEHAKEISATRAVSTGEHDYALLRIIGTFDGSQMPGSFAYLPVDTREAIGFMDDPVLVASYPAEFIGGITSQFSLFPSSTVTNIRDLLTFNVNTVDVLSLGGVIVAQSGSSGGAITNAWGRLVGIISTTSEGTTTAQRDLRAITLSYINRDISEQSGLDLSSILSGDIVARALDFRENQAPSLIQLLISNMDGSRN